MRIAVIFFLLLFFVIPAGSQEPVKITNRSETVQYIDGRPYYMHAVLQGQTLYSIARAYGVTQQDIIRENPDLEDGLRYDQIIRVPVIEEQAVPDLQKTAVAPDPVSAYIEHKVKQSETLFGISQKYSVSIEQILYYNPDARGILQIDQLLRIPLAAIAPKEKDDSAELPDLREDEFVFYDVAAGETFYGITNEFGITEEALIELNPKLEDGLQAGMRIRIPVKEVRDHFETDAPKDFITISRPQQPRTKAKFDDDCFEMDTEASYHVALLIPLFLEELLEVPDTLAEPDSDALFDLEFVQDTVKAEDAKPELLKEYIQPGHRSLTFISYYHGVLLALDSIRDQGVDITLHVFDVCQDIEKARKVTEKEEFKEMDLLIGPFHRQPLNHIAEYGRKHDIPVISPLLADNRQLQGFPNLIKSTPALETMFEGLSTHISQNYPHQNIIIVHNQQPGAAALIESFRDTLLTQVALVNAFHDSLNLARINGYYFDGALVGGRQTNLIVMPDTVSVMIPVRFPSYEEITLPKPYNVQEVIFRYEGMEGVLRKMRPDRENVLVTLISGEPFLSDYLRQLHTKRHHYDITVFGIPEWREYESIEIDYFQNLKVHIFSPSFYDYRDTHIRDFVYRYRKLFRTEPSADAFKAAQNAYFFFDALNHFGKDFIKCMGLLESASIETPFSFDRPFGAESGWENRHFHITRIINYRWVDVKRPLEVARSSD